MCLLEWGWSCGLSACVMPQHIFFMQCFEHSDFSYLSAIISSLSDCISVQIIREDVFLFYPISWGYTLSGVHVCVSR